MAETRWVGALDDATREAMWELYRGSYARAERGRFLMDLAEKDHVILVRDEAEQSVQGFTTIASYPHIEPSGKRLRIVFSGDTIIAAAYQGQTALQRAFVRYVLRLVLMHPHETVYWFLISKGYKTYLLLSRNFLEYWPRHDQAMPPDAARLIATLARQRFGSAFRDALGIVRFDPPGPRLEPWVAPLDPSALVHPDIRFFVTMNPGWSDGDELACIGKVDVPMVLNYLRRLAGRIARRAFSA